MKEKTDPVYANIDKARDEILKISQNLESTQGEIAAKRIKNLKQADAFLEKTAKKKQPDEIIQSIKEALKTIEKQNKADYASLQKQYDKEIFETISLQAAIMKIYKYILKGK